ncbi:hypothetical protein GPJ56_005887 [Histomonas meleagridis]|uniref:uncharacterized protein n=1 Tax=Histomonas meleagridis TaxID=135588 RepID=UPI00355AAB30|nr:hypothetical protein GPJ56_005887 [Histomonas meleagridis]KAH0801903.1 hypothetical protein GO595_005321 [Histomonas meleagridis]
MLCNNLKCIIYKGKTEPTIVNGAFAGVTFDVVVVTSSYQSSKFGTFSTKQGNTCKDTPEDEDSNTVFIVSIVVPFISLTIIIILVIIKYRLIKKYNPQIKTTRELMEQMSISGGVHRYSQQNVNNYTINRNADAKNEKQSVVMQNLYPQTNGEAEAVEAEQGKAQNEYANPYVCKNEGMQNFNQYYQK